MQPIVNIYSKYIKRIFQWKRKEVAFQSRKVQADVSSNLQLSHFCDTTHLQLSLPDKYSSLELLGQHWSMIVRICVKFTLRNRVKQGVNKYIKKHWHKLVMSFWGQAYYFDSFRE